MWFGRHADVLRGDAIRCAIGIRDTFPFRRWRSGDVFSSTAKGTVLDMEHDVVVGAKQNKGAHVIAMPLYSAEISLPRFLLYPSRLARIPAAWRPSQRRRHSAGTAQRAPGGMLPMAVKPCVHNRCLVASLLLLVSVVVQRRIRNDFLKYLESFENCVQPQNGRLLQSRVHLFAFRITFCY